MVCTLKLTKLTLTHFRNYESASLQFEGGVTVLTGHNGAGKTNILEAISFLCPGKGLRQIPRLTEADQRFDDKTLPWTVSAQVEGHYGAMHIGTGRDPMVLTNRRLVRVDGKTLSSQAMLANLFGVMWLTPQMDGLFLDTSSQRRRFLDRMVYHFNPEHVSHLYSYEYHMRERAKLLQEKGRIDLVWLSMIEAKMAERAVAIAAARIDALLLIQQSIDAAPTHFPKAVMTVEGLLEGWLSEYTALEVEEKFKKILYESRQQDAITRRTRFGVHRSDMIVFHAAHSMPASSCSTGEQKALLLSILLAEARAKIHWRETVPVLLLDEVVAHLDVIRRQALYDELLDMQCQVFITGTDDALFSSLRPVGQFMKVGAGRVVIAA